MSTVTTRAGDGRVPGGASAARLGFGRVLRAEWIKLRTLRSTWWCAALVVVVDLLFGLLIALVVPATGARSGAAGQEQIAVIAVTVGTTFAQLIAAVLGVLVISGEYGTGMIRSTFAAVPTRLPAIGAKLLVLVAWTFLVGLVAAGLTLLTTFGLLAGRGIHPHYGDPAVWSPMVGSAVYLALVAALAFAIGTLLRNSGGGIATVIGLLLVVPIGLAVAGGLTQAAWIRTVTALLPSSAGGQLYAYATPRGGLDATDALVLDGWGGLLVLLAWIGVLLLPALILVRARDA